MNFSKRLLALAVLVLGLALCPATFAQTLLTEDFTGTTSSANTSGTGNWLFYNGACLTAGTATVLTPPASSIPACTAVLISYYKKTADGDAFLAGGVNGFLGGTSAPGTPAGQRPDPASTPNNPIGGALRFTNASAGSGVSLGNQQRGAIVSTNAYSTADGIQVTFKTVTYGGSGADGISFYLMDGCVPVLGGVRPSDCAANPIYPTGSPNVPAIGATGGSLAYSCSNTNGPTSGVGVTYDGLTNGYLGLGIDEYGNFLNASDNTATGPSFTPGRIGLRGAGAISWPALNNAYGSDPNDLSKPYYPATLTTSCAAGYSWDANAATCAGCQNSATYTGSTNAGQVGSCSPATNTTYSCPAGSSSLTWNGTLFCVANPACPNSAQQNYGIYVGTQSATHQYGYCTNLSVSHKYDPNTVAQTATTTGNLVTAITGAQQAVQQTCSTGNLYNYKGAPGGSSTHSAGAASLTNSVNTARIMDYAPINGASLVVTSSTQSLYNGSATTRAQATPIFYNLKITSDTSNNAYLSLSYAYNGGSYQPIITNQNITASNGSLPPYVRFGFAGSTGGSTNIHEILCFKSAPANQSASSAGVNEKQSAKVDTGTYAYFAYYDTNNWIGRVTAQQLESDSTGVVKLDAPAWDASCVLTGLAGGAKCASTNADSVAATAPASRVILTYNGGGVAFKWASLSSAQQTALGAGDPATAPGAGQARFNYLRGDRSDEITSAGTCGGGLFDTTVTPNVPVCFRARTSVLGDIVGSSPTWIGAPQSPYTATWKDARWSTGSTPENGTQSYAAFIAAQQTRPNIVYVGSNDGMLHGFESGANDSTGKFSQTTNDGKEVIAYVPGSLLLSASSGGACASLTATGTEVQNIHGVTPVYGSAQTAACVNAALDFSSPSYGHNFFVDATPGTGDLYYSNAWHTWLVGGLGAGGKAIYALDVTSPTSTNFVDTNAASLVKGEWTASTLYCSGESPPSNAVTSPITTCGKNLGQTFGTPIIRRLHNGLWAVIFGNGYKSQTGDAGIYIMTVDASGSKTFYYLSTGKAGGNGIAYVTSADLDGDHITDYVYAGDLLGNVWRFDLTSQTAATWATTNPNLLFTTATGQPITTAVTVSSGATTAGANTLIVAFGTGERSQFTNTSPVTYPPSTATTTYVQALYGIWDWNMASWNAASGTQYASLSSPSGLGTNNTMSTANLLSRTFSVATTGTDTTTRDVTGTNALCWSGSPGCTGTAANYGWYLNLPGTLEQIIFNPQLLQGVFTVNSVVPANNQPLSCSNINDTGFTYALSVLTGNVVPNFFVSYHDTLAGGIETDAVGTSFPVTSSTGSIYMVSQTVGNQPIVTQVNPGSNAKGKRLSWVQLR